MKRFALIALAILLLCTCACGKKTAEEPQPPSAAPSPEVTVKPSPSPEVTETPAPEVSPEPEEPEEPVYTGPWHPLTGLPVEEDISNKRPYAIMLNNIKAALPQYAVSQADIIYEMLAEGGITRMLGVFQDVREVGAIGSVRSARDYYLDLAQGLDAIYVHGGGSPKAYDEISNRGVAAIDGIKGKYAQMFYRDQYRMNSAGYEHSLFTSGELIEKCAGDYGYRLEHETGYSNGLLFADAVQPAGGKAENVRVEFSGYKTGLFEYDAESGLYKISQYGAPYTDGAVGEQVAVKNVLVLYCEMYTIAGDDAGRMAADLVGSGTGYFICNGTYCKINWQKDAYSAPFIYTLEDGTPLELARGTSYVNILPDDRTVEIS